MKRRNFIKKTSLVSVTGVLSPYLGKSNFLSPYGVKQSVLQETGELLYNGIRLSSVWPPGNFSLDNFAPMPVPYLDALPEVIPIDIGRQLWVDDFLIKETTLEREFHLAVKHENNPLLTAEKEWEKSRNRPNAAPISGGVYWDPKDRLFKMWYSATWIGSLAYATSENGINWNRPSLDIEPDTNLLLKDIEPASTSVILDHNTQDPGQRFKLFWRKSGGGVVAGEVRVSQDGIHWSLPKETGEMGDRSTMFYNPFRKKWVYSIRSSGRGDLRSGIGRARYYIERDSFMEASGWESGEPVFWMGADSLDPVDPEIRDRPQLYNHDAVAYESLMLGVFQVHRGPANPVINQTGNPKITELVLAYSRDGFHWHRPDRRPFIEATRKDGDWDRGYLQSVGGVCLVVGDELWFYYGGFKGTGTTNGAYRHGSTGMAKLRRDGFASLNAGQQGGMVTTRKLTFSGRYLFVNVACPEGELKAEILDEQGEVIAPFSLTNSIPVAIDKTCVALTWNGADDLSEIAGQQVSFRFHLKNGKFYSFWVSPDESGASYGYVAAGGPGFEGDIDTVGLNGNSTVLSQLMSWRFSSPNSVGSEESYLSTTTDSRINQSELTRGAGLEPAGYIRGFVGLSKSWNASTNNPTTRASAYANGEYFQFTVKAREGYGLSLSSIDFKLRRSANGADTYRWTYSLNGGTFSDIGASDISYTDSNSDGDVQPTVDLSGIESLQNLTASDKVTFRLYLWGYKGVTSGGVIVIGRYPGSDLTPSLLVKGVISESPLLVSLIGFTAKPQENNVKLDWSTVSESNNSRFEILRSGNGERFDVIGTVSGKGTTSVLTRYSFTDFSPLSGTSYYRLRQIDFNGDYTESDIKVVSVLFKKASLSVSASNNEPTVALNVYAERNVNAQVFITNTEGKKIVQSSFLLNEGENKLWLPVYLTKGIYIATLIAPDVNISNKFIKE